MRYKPAIPHRFRITADRLYTLVGPLYKQSSHLAHIANAHFDRYRKVVEELSNQAISFFRAAINLLRSIVSACIDPFRVALRNRDELASRCFTAVGVLYCALFAGGHCLLMATVLSFEQYTADLHHELREGPMDVDFAYPLQRFVAAVDDIIEHPFHAASEAAWAAQTTVRSAGSVYAVLYVVCLRALLEMWTKVQLPVPLSWVWRWGVGALGCLKGGDNFVGVEKQKGSGLCLGHPIFVVVNCCYVGHSCALVYIIRVAF